MGSGGWWRHGTVRWRPRSCFERNPGGPGSVSALMMSVPYAAPALTATCPDHSGFKPVGTCARCGRFVCARCETWGELCAACEHRKLKELSSTATMGLAARWMLGLRVLLALSGAALHRWMLGRLSDGLPGGEDAETYSQLNALLVLGLVVCTVLTAILFLRWLYLVVKTVKVLGLDPGVSPGWAVGWWFVPLANLWDPYLLVRGLWRSLGGSRAGTAAISAWWTAWVLGGISLLISERMFWGVEVAPLSITSALLAAFVTEVLFLIAALLCIRVIAQLQAQLDDCADEVAEQAGYAP
jgi:hypothetical protein